MALINILKISTVYSRVSLTFRFNVYIPKDLNDALRALKVEGEGLLPIAGGTDLLVLYRQGLVKFSKLLDLWPLRNSLSYVRFEGGYVKIGALTTVSELLDSRIYMDKRFLGFKDACSGFASPFIRSIATVGGNVGAAHPLSDIAILLLAYDANVKLASLDGERLIPLREFFIDKRKTLRKPDELIVELSFKEPPTNSSTSLIKLDRRVGHSMGYVIVSTYLELIDDVVKDVRIVFDSMGKPYPERAYKTEEYLRGKTLSEDVVKEASESILPNEMRRITDYRSSAEYRVELSKVLLKRALFKTKERILGGA